MATITAFRGVERWPVLRWKYTLVLRALVEGKSESLGFVLGAAIDYLLTQIYLYLFYDVVDILRLVDPFK